MSLLLDALKKTGDSQQKGTGLSGLTLEEASPSRATSASPTSDSSSRAAGHTLFAAKKNKPARRWNLGLVPTTLLICSVLGAGYGYYVWLQLQPPSQAFVAQRTAPPPVVAPVAAVPLVPRVPAPEESVAQPELQPVVTARNDVFGLPRNKPKTGRSRSKLATPGLTIQHEVETDSITPALLEAWQAYQRGDYVTAAQGYRQVLGKDAHNRDALLGMAATAQQQGQEEASQRYYRQMLVLDPRDPVAHAALSVYLPGDAGDTESRLKQLLAGEPRSGALHFALGNLYAEQSSWGDAQQYYFNAYSLEPSNAQYAFNLAVSLDHLGQRKLAAQHYQKALQLDVSGNSGFDRAQAQQRLNELTTAH